MEVTASGDRAREFRRIIGDPAGVASELASFRESALALSSEHPRFIDKYPQHWVAVYGRGEVIAAPTLEGLLADVDARGVDRHSIVVRFIERSEKALIL